MRNKGYLFLGLFLCIIFISGCQNSKKNNSNESTSVTTDISINNNEDIVIKTKCGELHYPDQWEDLIEIEEKVENQVAIINFKTEIGENTYQLFDVIIGDAEGTSVGKIIDEKGFERDVYIQIYDIQEDSNLNEGEQRRLYAMQEDLNYLIDKLN